MPRSVTVRFEPSACSQSELREEIEEALRPLEAEGLVKDVQVGAVFQWGGDCHIQGYFRRLLSRNAGGRCRVESCSRRSFRLLCASEAIVRVDRGSILTMNSGDPSSAIAFRNHERPRID